MDAFPELPEAARALIERAREARATADDAELDRVAREIVALGAAQGDDEVVAWGNYNLGVALYRMNRGDEAAAANRAAYEHFKRAGKDLDAAKALMNLATVELAINVNTAEARRLYEESIGLIRGSGDRVLLAISLGNLAELLRLENDYKEAIATARESIALHLEIGNFGNAAMQYAIVAHCQSLLRDFHAAVASMREGFAYLRQQLYPRWVAEFFDTWAIIASGRGDLERSATLLAFVDRYRFEHSVRRLQSMLPWLSDPRERIAREFTDTDSAELTATGEALSVEQAQALAETLIEG
jgi:tetratricopeptide (TPR) repeat protein